jgi:hypothetical protein
MNDIYFGIMSPDNWGQITGGITMAKSQSPTLRWKPVDSKDVIGYKVYWSKSDTVSYDSESVCVQDLTEIIISDALKGLAHEPGIYRFGITAIDRWGNESDITKLSEPFKFSATSIPASNRLDIKDSKLGLTRSPQRKLAKGLLWLLGSSVTLSTFIIIDRFKRKREPAVDPIL